ncbi:MAG: amidase [Sphingopyxis sp.]|nr:amidase [Sphingopyxis sp.]
MMNIKDASEIGLLDMHDQAGLVRRGELSPGELIEAAIVRAEALDSGLNALSVKAWEQARCAAPTADGEMRGVPWLVKEGLDYAGMPTRSGSRAFSEAIPATSGSPYTRCFDDAGMVAIGKSSAPEFGLLPTTEPLLYGPVHNPWSPGHSAGGSSGGATAAVAAGIVPVAHAADGGGSIRIPAGCCGLVGLKPTRGSAVRARDLHAIEDFLVGDTLVARSVRDVAWATRRAARTVMTPVERNERQLRIGLVLDSLDGNAPEPEVAAAIGQAAELCADLGHIVVPFQRREDGPRVAACFETIWGYVARDAVNAVRARGLDMAQLEPWTLGLFDWSARFGPGDLDDFHRAVAANALAHESSFEDVDILLSPVLRRATVPLGELAPDRPFDALFAAMFDYIGYTPLHNLTGNPALSLPLVTMSDGMPIGSMFSARRGDDALLLALALQLEEATGWSKRWPAVSIRQFTA